MCAVAHSRGALGPPWGPPTGTLLRGRAPVDVAATVRFHGLHAVPGVEAYDGRTFTRTLRLPGGPGRVGLTPAGRAGVRVALELTDPADGERALTLVRDLLDLRTDPRPVDAALAADPALAPLVAARPGMRSPGTADGVELAVRTVVGQQVSLAGARTVLGRIAAAHGERVAEGPAGLLFPAPATLAGLDPVVLPLPRARGRALVGLAAAAVEGRLQLWRGADARAQAATLLGLPGIGPWTADYLRMRVFGDPDVLLVTDLAVRRVAAEHGLDLADAVLTRRWSPWRSYVTHHLWAVVLARL